MRTLADRNYDPNRPMYSVVAVWRGDASRSPGHGYVPGHGPWEFQTHSRAKAGHVVNKWRSAGFEVSVKAPSWGGNVGIYPKPNPIGSKYYIVYRPDERYWIMRTTWIRDRTKSSYVKSYPTETEAKQDKKRFEALDRQRGRSVSNPVIPVIKLDSSGGYNFAPCSGVTHFSLADAKHEAVKCQREGRYNVTIGEDPFRSPPQWWMVGSVNPTKKNPIVDGITLGIAALSAAAAAAIVYFATRPAPVVTSTSALPTPTTTPPVVDTLKNAQIYAFAVTTKLSQIQLLAAFHLLGLDPAPASTALVLVPPKTTPGLITSINLNRYTGSFVWQGVDSSPVSQVQMPNVNWEVLAPLPSAIVPQ